ncbi:CrcB family protein [Microbacterium sp. zg.Y625]|uniref:fluoride efflux transporter FluC n=1 Tax=Microbacterium jiangjiandongii TaxID=3049071 RepID=UPI00214B8952|nr:MULTISPECIES: CrcB family protein [unclassified Microbacterium]MCR2792064.1 CrcB family protein [Microbacterium sp. zg.Y625]MCR2814851.1 CrcB family protein [Microbacterium sp. zg.Y843]WIM24871.1 CrcB family protein [Microbacterium sp. zg-Y625]
MTFGVFLLAVVGGGLGAAIRFVTDGLIMRRVTSGYPWGTFVINSVGSLLLGFLTGLSDSSVLDAAWLTILGGGVMGGFTTFSTAMVDTVHMLQKRTYGRFFANSLGMLVLTVLLAVVGLAIGRAL